jgi:hypothetical protein
MLGIDYVHREIDDISKSEVLPFDEDSPKKANPQIRDALLARMNALFEKVT